MPRDPLNEPRRTPPLYPMDEDQFTGVGCGRVLLLAIGMDMLIAGFIIWLLKG